MCTFSRPPSLALQCGSGNTLQTTASVTAFPVKLSITASSLLQQHFQSFRIVFWILFYSLLPPLWPKYGGKKKQGVKMPMNHLPGQDRKDRNIKFWWNKIFPFEKIKRVSALPNEDFKVWAFMVCLWDWFLFVCFPSVFSLKNKAVSELWFNNKYKFS